MAITSGICKVPPEPITQDPATNGGLKIETHERNRTGNFPTVPDDILLLSLCPGTQAQKSRMITQFARRDRLCTCLRGQSAKACNLDARLAAKGFPRIDGLGCKRQNGTIKSVFPVANFKLRGVHAHRNAADARIQVIAHHGALATLGPAPPPVQGERQRRNDMSFKKVLSQV